MSAFSWKNEDFNLNDAFDPLSLEKAHLLSESAERIVMISCLLLHLSALHTLQTTQKESNHQQESKRNEHARIHRIPLDKSFKYLLDYLPDGVQANHSRGLFGAGVFGFRF